MKKITQASSPAKTIGTIIGDKARAKANSYGDAKRQSLTERGMALIYGGSGYAKATTTRR